MNWLSVIPCVSLKWDVHSHPPLYMVTLCIDKVDVWGFYKLTWSCISDQLTIHCIQQLGALYCVREYFGWSGLAIAYKSFQPVGEFSDVIFTGASINHLYKLDAVEKMHG